MQLKMEPICELNDYLAVKDIIEKNVVGMAFLKDLDVATELFVEKKWKNCVSCCEICLDITWEKLNTGYWKDVSMSWRYAYTFVSVAKAFSEYHLLKEDCKLITFKDLMKTCDMGLLMGAPVLNNVLSRMAEYFRHCVACKPLQESESKICVEKDENSRSEIKRSLGISNDVTVANKSSRFEVQRESLPSIETFKAQFLDKNEPCVIENSMTHWPAMAERKWTLEYIKHVAGCRTVPIEIGSKYTDEDWSQKLMLVSDFIEQFFSGANSKQGYLAQHQLFDQLAVVCYCCDHDLLMLPTSKCMFDIIYQNATLIRPENIMRRIF